MLFLETHQFARPYGRVLVLIYPTFTVPFWTWLLMGFFKSLPKEVEESAMVDGCSRVAAIWRMVLPPVALVRGDVYLHLLPRPVHRRLHGRRERDQMTVARAWALFTGSAHPSNGLTSHGHAGFTVGAIK